jgi:hypothetical protein
MDPWRHVYYGMLLVGLGATQWIFHPLGMDPNGVISAKACVKKASPQSGLLITCAKTLNQRSQWAAAFSSL